MVEMEVEGVSTWLASPPFPLPEAITEGEGEGIAVSAPPDVSPEPMTSIDSKEPLLSAQWYSFPGE